jgi:hypothetical protein
MSPKIILIGAGPSGITALKNLLDKGLDVLCLDANGEVGGNWIFSEESTHSSVFETTHIISSKTLSQYEDYTFDDHNPNTPDYPSHQQLKDYFQAYARKFNLNDHIQFNTRVLSAERMGEKQWNVIANYNGVEVEYQPEYLVVANGHHWDPRMPSYPGEFNGQILHSHAFKTAQPFENQRVLVIGGGNSACDVAVETSRVSEKTSISWRRGYRIVPKFLFGKPTDVSALKFHFLPRKVRNTISETILKVLNGKNSDYGLPEPDHAFGATHPTVNDELLYKIRHGKVHPKPDIDHYEGNTVFFTDGTSEDYDVIIACTGYKISHPFFEKSFVNYTEGPVDLYLKMMHAEFADLYFIGLFQPLGCIWPGAEQQSKLMAAEIAGEYSRPENIHAAIENQLNNPHYKQIDTPRHTITVDFHIFMKEIQQQLKKIKTSVS